MCSVAFPAPVTYSAIERQAIEDFTSKDAFVC